jgi:hypothetical protein
MLTVYLDQKDWIALAKAVYRKDATKNHQAIARRLHQFADAKLVRFPLSETHFMETGKIGKQSQRQNLVSVLSTFSQGWCLASRQARMAYEIEAAVAHAFGIRSPRPRFDAFAKDFLSAFGEYPFLSQLLGVPVNTLKLISANNGSCTLITDYLSNMPDHIRRPALERLTDAVQELTLRIHGRQNSTRHESAEMRSRIYSVLLFLEIEPKLGLALQAVDRTFDDFRRLPAERKRAIIDCVPALDVERCLALRSEREAPSENNDLFDIAALSAAIPYCDIVVTEKSWVHLASVSGVAAKYDTFMASSLEELDTELSRRFR